MRQDALSNHRLKFASENKPGHVQATQTTQPLQVSQQQKHLTNSAENRNEPKVAYIATTAVRRKVRSANLQLLRVWLSFYFLSTFCFVSGFTNTQL